MSFSFLYVHPLCLLSSAGFLIQNSLFIKECFRNTISVSTGLLLDLDRRSIQTVCKVYQQTTKVAPSRKNVKLGPAYGLNLMIR